MRLESALYASRGGLNANGQALGVIGDNIANANTTGYKASRSEFADLVSEGSEGRQSTAIQGGGSGVQVQKIRQIHETGVVEFTGRSLDVAIAGDGFFMAGDAADPVYTRAGNFQVNADGTLVTADGLPVLGLVGETTTLGNLDLDSINVNGAATSTSEIVGNLDSTSENTVPPENPITFRQVSAAASYVSGYTVYDSLGDEHGVTLAFFKTANNTWTVQAYLDGGEVGGTEGQPVQIGEDLELTFTEQGIIAEGDQASAVINAAPAYSNGAAAGNFTIDLGTFTQYAQTSQLIGVNQNGQAAGEITGYEFQDDGKLVAILSSGARELVGTIQLQNFTNVDGLQRIGTNYYRAGEGSGAITAANPGAAGTGELEGSSLERSTVDLANQFVELIVYQRGYQASSQALNVAGNMIRDTLSLIR